MPQAIDIGIAVTPLNFAAPITVRVPGALQLTGLSRTKLYALIKAGEIEIIKVGGATLIVVESIHRFVERSRRSAGRFE